MLNRKDRIHTVTNKTVFVFIQMLTYAAKELSTPFWLRVFLTNIYQSLNRNINGV